MHRQEIRMASIKMVIKTSLQNNVRKLCLFLAFLFKNFMLFSWFMYGHNLLFGHTKQSSVRRTEDSSVYPFYLLFKVPRNCCEGEAKSVCYGRVLMASDAFCQKGWNNLNCCVGNGSKCWPNQFLRLTQTDVAFSQEITVGIQIFNGFKWWWKENVSGGSKSIFGNAAVAEQCIIFRWVWVGLSLTYTWRNAMQ